MVWQAYKLRINKKSILFFICSLLLIIGYILVLTLLKYRCPLHELFGIWCPGCGGTRMIVSFVHLDFYQAFRWNPFCFILLIVGLIYLITGIIIYIRKRVIIVPTVKVWIFLIVLLVIYMIIRNIDMFSYLIPTRIS